MNIIVVGNGGREHTIAWKIAQSSSVEKVVCVPGNGGTAKEEKCLNVEIKDCGYINGSENPYIQIAKHENCTMAVIGPEDPLAEGLADVFWAAGIPCVGPKKAAAQLEASKDLSKDFMEKYGVACAKSKRICQTAWRANRNKSGRTCRRKRRCCCGNHRRRSCGNHRFNGIWKSRQCGAKTCNRRLFAGR